MFQVVGTEVRHRGNAATVLEGNRGFVVSALEPRFTHPRARP
jgi:hypothetical protein